MEIHCKIFFSNQRFFFPQLNVCFVFLFTGKCEIVYVWRGRVPAIQQIFVIIFSHFAYVVCPISIKYIHIDHLLCVKAIMMSTYKYKQANDWKAIPN